MKKYYHRLCLITHPDKQPPTMEPRQKDRLAHFFKIISGIHNTYTTYPEGMRAPDPTAFEGNEDEVPPAHDCDNAPPPSAENHSGRRVYLVTFSHSDKEGRRSPSEFSRREFGVLLIAAFEASIADLRVEYGAVFQELHVSAKEDAGRKVHFHASIKSNRQHLWAPIADHLRRHHHVYVHFAVSGDGYWSAFRYGWWPTKHKPMAELDKEFELLNGTEVHPTPSEAAKPPPWSSRKRKRTRKGESQSSSTKEEEGKHGGQESTGAHKCRREAVRSYAFRLIEENNLTTADSFLAHVLKLRDPRLISLFMSNSATNIVEIANNALQAQARLKRSTQSRLDILREAADSSCECESPGNWKKSALDLLNLQNISPAQFAAAVVLALESGAEKAVNVFIHGTTTSGKSWILDPLRAIYRCHLTPPNKSGFPLQDLPEKEVILWQDFRLDEEVIPWASLLLVFEGTAVTIRRPRTTFQSDYDFKVKQPVFITSAAVLAHQDKREDDMMKRRFRFFHFSKTIPASQVRKLPPCGHCFASLLLSLTAPPSHAPELTPVNSKDAGGSQDSSSDSGLPRSASSSSTDFPYCRQCGLATASSPFCGATGERHS